MNKKLKRVLLGGGLALFAAILVISACSTNSPLDSNLPQTASADKFISYSGGSQVTSTYDSALIEKDDGGVIDIVSGPYEHQFVVQAGALDQDTQIWVKTYKDTVLGKSVLVFEFGPDGLVFKEASNLLVDMGEINSRASSAKLYYFDPSAGRWVYLSSSPVVDGVAAFDINHFSKYAIGD